MRYAVQQRRAGARYKTLWTFPIDRPSQALLHYRGLNAFDGWIKRLVIIDDNGHVTETLRRDTE